ncbi:MAG: hypothetical protein HFF18_06375 [Oscillospiraceae bacterium]|nr:hypothetical protein [Oscillospiraceae bacterium]
MDKNIRGGTLLIRTAGEQSNVEISGTRTDIIFNWTALTNQICQTIGLSPLALAVMMPEMISDYRRNAIKCEIKMEGKADA